MRKSLVAAIFGLAATPVLTAPVLNERYSPFPLPDGFPSPSPAEILTIEEAAGGSLSNAPPPATLSAVGIVTLRLIAFNELFEVAYFTELLQNITSCQPGYEDFGGFSKEFVVESLTAIIAQEKLHTLGANGALALFNGGPIQPCQYTFPVNCFEDAIALAGTFTDLILGTLQAVEFAFATNGDVGLLPGITSIVAQEGEQEGWYRIIQGKRPSSSAFLTASAPSFAFTALQNFIIPGSCPNIDTITIPILLPLAVTTVDPQPVNQTLTFEVTGSVDMSGMFVAYISGQNVAVVEPITNVVSANGKTTFSAFFPFQDGFALFSNGLTIAAVTKSSGPFVDAAAVAAAAVYGPGLIEIG